MRILKRSLLLVVLSSHILFATKVAPTAQGAYYSGVKAYGYTVTFTGSGSHDNDDQNGGSTPQYQWDFDYVGTTFTVDASTTNTLITHAYNAPGTFRVGVKYMDNDGQWSQPYPFTITIREVRRVFYVKDHLGNIRQSINESGTVVSAQDYYPYGETLRGYISIHPYEKYRFTEKERDIETGYDYFGGRLYDSQLGIWGQVDPKAYKNPAMSPFNYCQNDPLNRFDPDGREDWKLIWKGVVQVGLGMAYAVKSTVGMYTAFETSAATGGATTPLMWGSFLKEYATFTAASISVATGVGDINTGFKTPDGMSGEAIDLIKLAGKDLGMSDKQLIITDVTKMIMLTRSIVSNLNTTEALMFLAALNDCDSLTQEIKDVVETLSKEKTQELKKELEEQKKKEEEQLIK